MSSLANLVYRRNVRLLQRYSPALFRDLETAALPRDWRAVPARSGDPTLVAVREGRETAVHSRYDPRREAETWALGVGDDWEMLVVLGLGLGYHLEILQRLYPGRTILVLEPELATVKLAFSARDLTPLLKGGRFYLLVAAEPQEAAEQLANILAENAGKKIMLQALPAYSRLYSGYWENVCREVTDRLRQRRVNWATTENFMQQWLLNYRDNFWAYLTAPGVARLFNAFADKPAIIVAAGPSLEKNVHLLPSLRGKALIIAAGSAIRVLEKNGATPDLLVSFDPSEANYQHFADFDGGDIPLVYAPVIYPRIVREYQGPTLSCELNVSPFIEWFDDRLGEKKGSLVSGPSVANVCLDLAVKLGCNPIILVGQDLAFTNNKTHADGARHQRAIDPTQGNYIWVEDVYGGKVPTTTAFYSMLVWFEQYLRQLGDRRLVIDATEGGARIRGTEVMPLQEAAQRYLQEEFSPQDVLEETVRHYSPPAAEQLRSLAGAFADLRAERQELHACFEEGVKVAQGLLEKCRRRAVQPATFQRAARKFRSLDRRVTGNLLYQLFLAPGLAARVDAINRVLGERVNSESKLAAKGENLALLYLAFFTEVERYAAFTASVLSEIENTFPDRLAARNW